MALTLRRKGACKVDARHVPIEIGNLLTTSHKAGHAMKAEGFRRALGAGLGKALKALCEGTGTIPIMVALQ
jgi:hypothetical protein